MSFRGILGIFLIFAIGCDGGPPPSANWMAERDSTGFLPVQDSPDICRNCIVLEKLAELGDADGPGYVERTQAVLQDGLGQYWVHQRDELKVFASTGGFLRVVGRAGQGPMEWSRPLPVFRDDAGNVHIIDEGNDRETIVTPQFELVEERPIPGGDLNALAPLSKAGQYVVNMWRGTDKAIGFPLHIAEGEDVLRSFGVSGDKSQQDSFKSRRRLAIDRFGRVFSAKDYEYEIEVWTETGDRIGGLQGPVLNRSEVKPSFFNRDDNPLPNVIIGLQAVDSTMLLVVSRRPVENWRDHYEDRTYPGVGVGLVLKEGSTPDKVYTARIEFIDLRTRTIIARQDQEEGFSRLVGPGLLLEDRTQDLARPHLGIWRVRLGPGSG